MTMHVTDGSRNASVDGSGELPSMRKEFAVHTLAYIGRTFGHAAWVCDLGAGLGVLAAEAQRAGLTLRVDSLEGCGELAKKLPAPAIVWDLTQDVPFPQDLEDGYDLTTSFELLEHIETDKIDRVLRVITRLAPHHLGSIHVKNEESHFHQTIRPKGWWNALFDAHGWEVDWLTEQEVVGSDGIWDCSVFFKARTRGSY
jgi:2-polyprenyl-3-methyl-5-hydroxy-6-metoxy-1,4-benzoquinol methylase